MSLTAEAVRGRLLEGFPEAEVSVVDTTGGGDHFAATVISPIFSGKGLIERHRMVYAALGAWMAGPIHALAITAETPEENVASRTAARRA